MDWTAPQVDRVEPVLIGDERTMLESWLEFHRHTLLTKCTGLTAEQLKRASVEPSNLSLLGLVRHMTEVERSWFRRRFAGEPIDFLYCDGPESEADVEDVATADAAADYAALLAEVEVVRTVAAGHSLDETFFHARYKQEMSLRWVYVHMIEEYARHNGHADLIRERIDGATGE
jgi:uncharacterized damage-inducible protein DinB